MSKPARKKARRPRRAPPVIAAAVVHGNETLHQRLVAVEEMVNRRHSLMTQLDVEQHRAQALLERTQWLCERIKHLEEMLLFYRSGEH